MANISVGAAIGAGFGLITRRPLAVLAWGLLPAVLQIVAITILAPTYVALFSQIAASGAAGGSSSPFMSPAVTQLQGVSNLLNVVQLAVSAVLYCAIFRAVLRPEKSSFAFLRASAEEFYVLVLTFGAGIAFVVAFFVLAIPIVIVGAIAGVATHSAGVGMAVGVPLYLVALVVLLVFVGLRFVFVGPMIVEDGKFHLFESWRMTRGHVGSLFLIGLGVFGIMLLLEILIVVVLIAFGAGAVGALGGLEAARTLFETAPQTAIMRSLPFLGVFVVLMIPVSGALQAIAIAPWARAYQDVAPGAADTFA